MEFQQLATAVAKKFQSMTATGLFQVDVDKDLLWNTYLASFPEGSNPIYKVRTEHDCSCCRSFVRTMGGTVSIVDGKLVSIWDVRVHAPFQVVMNTLSDLVKAAAVDNIFLHTEKTAGTANSRQLLEDKSVKTWNHFFLNLPGEVVVKSADIGPKLSDLRATHDVMLRSLNEITLESIDTVLELIAQDSLYRGGENKFVLDSFRKLKVAFSKLKTDQEKDLFVWSQVKNIPASVSKIRNTSIGSLLTDISEGYELEDAVKSFEAKVAPTNYKRPTALVTKSMIADAQAKLQELGLDTSLDRRYATIEDITINNILFADRSARKEMNVFEELAQATPEKTKTLDKVEEVGIEDFLTKILPKAESFEVLFENRHTNQLVSLVTASDPTAKNLFKWPNHFSWSYTGELTDSIKEKVKAAGGRIDADFRTSLSWYNYDDLDLHLVEPNGDEIDFGNKHSTFGGQLDVDMNAGGAKSRSAVENIFYPSRARMLEGRYALKVNNFNQRETQDVGFEAEIEFGGTIHSFPYQKMVKNGETIVVAEFEYSKKDGLKIIKSLPSVQASKTTWGLATQTYQKVKVLMLSPNYWDGHGVGNKHYFFMLEGAQNETKARGFFNEFLVEDLSKHRKVFEMVGARMKTDESDRQLSGIGFSSTQRNNILVKVKGSFTRTIKLMF